MDVPTLDVLARERDLYLRLLHLSPQLAIAPLLKEALAVLVELSAARQGYIEVYDNEAPGGEPRWWEAHALSEEEVDDVRAVISRGIIAEALATGQTIVTPSAVLDPRFSARASVQGNRIEAVLCAPIGDDPPRGVLYLQGAPSSSVFSDEGRARAELVTRHLAPLVDRLLDQERRHLAADATQPMRRALRAETVIGHSPALAGVLKQTAQVAPLEISVLLTGDSGTGKTHVARVLHDNSPRAGGPFVVVNCGALPDTLIESELFGALPGAHSTAVRRVEGKVAAAEHGTLLFDEISDLSPAAQAKLLQLLQSKEYYPLGGAQPVTADVRVIAATNTDLKRAMAERRFREDLFYRLQVISIRLPSLAERREDIAELVAHFCARAVERHGLPHLQFSRNALRAAESADWPGNVRQLAHAVEAAAIRAAGEEATQVERHHLFADGDAPDSEPNGMLTFQQATRRFHTQLLERTLTETDWNVAEAARRLDVTRSYMYKLIRGFGLERQRG